MSSQKHTSAVQIRMARLEDAENITALINVAFRAAEEFFVEGDRIALAEVRELLGRGKFLLVERAGLLKACVYVEPRGDRSYLGLLSVEPGQQQAGLGSLIMRVAERYCGDLACRLMDIKVVSLREELFGFYQRRGYVETGTEPFPAEVLTKVPCHMVKMTKTLY